MIKAEIVVDFPKWKTKIKNPSLYFKKKIKKLSCVKSLKKKNFESVKLFISPQECVPISINMIFPFWKPLEKAIF